MARLTLEDFNKENLWDDDFFDGGVLVEALKNSKNRFRILVCNHSPIKKRQYLVETGIVDLGKKQAGVKKMRKDIEQIGHDPDSEIGRKILAALAVNMFGARAFELDIMTVDRKWLNDYLREYLERKGEAANA